ncbi:MAG: IS3 family transposase [Firmicutes bacterium]|nr:IS3 family transposase [Bacillota bacterium]
MPQLKSFFSAFKTERIYLDKPKTIQESKELCDEYIEFYNFERIILKHKSPHEKRTNAKIKNLSSGLAY